ncbi:MAG: ectoine hydrolase DoeA [Rhodobiaceae bacterium]|nr:ectoine hydrolase DoeA [Rhodobiaceae bacterium]
MAEKHTAFPQTEYDRRVALAHAAMEKAGLDVLFVTDPSNMAWLTGYDGWSFYVHQGVILPLGGAPVWWGRGQDTAGAVRTVWMPDAQVIGYADHYVQSTERHPMQTLAAALAERGFAEKRIGVEMDNYYFSAKAFAVLQAELPNATFVDATALVNWQRAVKSDLELDFMRRAGRIVAKMHDCVREAAEPGMRKNDLVAQIMATGVVGAEDAPGDYPAIVPLMPSGTDAAAPHLTWDDRPLKVGEGTFFELAGCYRRYHCPLSRTLFLGKPPAHFVEAEKATLEGMEAGLDAARPGNACEDIALAFFTVLERHGITKDNRTGYPIGLSYPPDWGERTMSLRRGDRTELRPGMTFHFMTGLWMDDWGMEITESIAITESGYELLSNVPRQMFVKD